MTSRTQFVAGTSATALALALARPVRAQARSVRVSYFSGIPALPLLTATQGGFFGREGLDVSATPATSSQDLFTKLDAGALDIVHAAIDNAIAYDVGAGPVALTNRDFVAFAGIDDGSLRLVARAGIARTEELRGKTVAVDALTTGFAFVVRALLSSADLAASDVTLVSRGGTQQRADGLLAGAFDATLLYPPFDLTANARGCVTVARAIDVLRPYQGFSVIARRAWLAENRDTAIRYARAFRAALGRVVTDRTGSIALLTTALSVPEAIAAASYDAVVAPDVGFRRDAGIDLAGVRTVLRLRARYAPPGAGDDPEPYVDSSILAQLR
jgi:ABC-type nitrate/sulfonate/bicarbonate transport system substrate-binding protein